MNYWYVARPNELFIDTDKMSRSLAHTKARLQGAIECVKLDVAYVMQRPSMRPDHCHTIITLKHEMYWLDRYVWEMILHGDIYRGFCNIMRSHSNILNADILISQYDSFITSNLKQERWPDDECECLTKHNSATMQTCPAAIRLRGDKRNMGFFGKPSKNPCKVWPE